MNSSFWTLPDKPSGMINIVDGSYGMAVTLGDTPWTCPECAMLTWALYQPFPHRCLDVCSKCFDKVQKQGGLTPSKK